MSFLSSQSRAATTCQRQCLNMALTDLKAGDHWCLCASRWQEAFEAGMAPKVNLRATHVLTLEFVNLADLEKFAL